MSVTDAIPARSRPARAGQIRSAAVDIVALDPGAFDAARLGSRDETLGLLILEGLIAIHLGAGRSRAACLIGPEDLLRPWDLTEISLNRAVRWSALTPVRARRFSSWAPPGAAGPRILPALLSRASRTTRWLLAQALILSDSRVEDRLLMSFSLWAGRWGRVTPHGIRVELPLTHELIGQLVGARRPTVTLAMGSLERDGLLTRHPRGGWVLDRGTYELNTGTASPDAAAAIGVAV